MNKDDVWAHIRTIKEQLRLGQAALMVGAGFSLNADRRDTSTPKPPDWKQLSEAFVQELYRGYSEEYQDRMLRTKTVLQLAGEYDTVYSRAKLNDLLKKIIRDPELFPNKLYESMLNLPWSDIFTTNYDTLLERAAKNIIDRDYTTIYACKDLALSEQPRIIKLHGSLPSESTHLIITEEDYRTYPTQYAPFVNTVRQSIVENTFCLVGFSGTDPNFVNWAGWVRDNLQKSMSPIFLIGILDISDSESLFLHEKNIIPVDLYQAYKTTDHKVALANFFKEIKTSATVSWTVKWESMKRLDRNNLAEAKTQSIELLSKWRNERESYPNWLIAPIKTRSLLVHSAERNFEMPEISTLLDDPVNIELLYEFNWRLEHGLMCIDSSWVPSYEKIVKRYNPFSISDQFFHQRALVDTIIDGKNIKQMWLDLIFSLFRWCREENDIVRLKQYETLLNKIIKIDNSSRDRLFYEKALNALFKPDVKRLKEILEIWEPYLSHPEWKVKFSALAAEFGMLESSRRELTSALNEIRLAIPRGKIKNDFYWLSLEGIALVGLQMHQQTKSFTHLESDNILREEYRARLNSISNIYCNPWENLEYFKLILDGKKVEYETTIKKRNFDNTTTTCNYLYGWDKNFLPGYQYFRFIEITGLPLTVKYVNLDNKTSAAAVKRVVDFLPIVAFSLLNRIGKTGEVDMELFFSQRQVFDISPENANNLVNSYLTEAIILISEYQTQLSSVENNFHSKLLENIIEAISRLTVRVDETTLQKIFDFVNRCYICDIDRFGLKFNNFKSLVRHVFEAMSPGQTFKNLETILQIPLPTNATSQNTWISPFDYINWGNYKVYPDGCNPDLTHLINHWVDRLKTASSPFVRRQTMHALFSLFDLGILSLQSQQTIMETIIQEKDEYGLPIMDGVYTFAVLKYLQHYDHLDIIKKGLIAYYKNYPIQFYQTKGEQISWRIPNESLHNYLQSLIINCSIVEDSVYTLPISRGDAWDIFINIQKCLSPAKSNLISLLKKDSFTLCDLKPEIKNTVRDIDQILGEVVIPKLYSDSARVQQIRQFIDSLCELHRFPVARVALIMGGNEFDITLSKEFISAISSNEKSVFDVYGKAVYCAYRYCAMGLIPSVPDEILTALVFALRMKANETFTSTCHLVANILPHIHLDEKLFEILFVELEALADSTSFSSKSERFPMTERYDYRIAVAHLAASLYKLYINKTDTIPAALQLWYENCHSPQEFPSLRNIWNQINS